MVIPGPALAAWYAAQAVAVQHQPSPAHEWSPPSALLHPSGPGWGGRGLQGHQESPHADRLASWNPASGTPAFLLGSAVALACVLVLLHAALRYS